MEKVDMNNNHKPIEISLKKPLSNQEMEIITKLERIFPKSDFFFKTSNSKCIFHLREIDIRYFKDMIRSLKTEYKLGMVENIFSKLISNVEEIKSYGLKGRKRLYVGYNRERKVKNRKEKERARVIYYYAIDHNFSEEDNELPNKFSNKIICGDSAKILKKLPENCVDLIFTSPPYNFGLD
ncbi:site-specific DNA-methyltransferase, partial [candidate division WOR-3 bacterium]|nr:site-specific DNA-methyltransferase [candidate division WOR-3 bacterium]